MLMVAVFLLYARHNTTVCVPMDSIACLWLPTPTPIYQIHDIDGVQKTLQNLVVLAIGG